MNGPSWRPVSLGSDKSWKGISFSPFPPSSLLSPRLSPLSFPFPSSTFLILSLHGNLFSRISQTCSPQLDSLRNSSLRAVALCISLLWVRVSESGGQEGNEVSSAWTSKVTQHPSWWILLRRSEICDYSRRRERLKRAQTLRSISHEMEISGK